MLPPKIEGTSETNRVGLICYFARDIDASHLISSIPGHAPVTVITCLDKLKTEEDQRDACYLAAGVTGGPGGRTHLISNYTKENNCKSLAVERSALDILESALISAESFIRVHKQKEKNQIEREIMASGTKLMPTVARRSVSGKTVPSVLSTAQGLTTSATVYPNEDRPRLVNQSDCRISEFVTEPSDKK